MLYGLIVLLPALLCFTNGVDIADGNDASPAGFGVGLIALSFLLLGLAGILLRGGWHMLALENYRAALLASFLGQPVGLWGLFMLSRPDVRSKFRSETKIRSQPIDRPRLSRCALAGAIWGALGMLALIVVSLMVTTVTDVESRPSTTTTSTDGPGNAIIVHSENDSNAIPENSPAKMMWGLVIFTVFAVALGGSSIFGATICGAVAVGHIKHSAGRLYGLRLAAADLLFYPMLMLAGLTAVLTHYACIAVWTNWPGPAVWPSPGSAPQRAYPGEAFVLIDALVALVVCYLAGRAVWRAIRTANGERGVSAP